MDAYGILRPAILISLLTIAAVTDISSHRVSNYIIAAGLILEAAVHIESHAEIDRESLSLSLLFIIIIFMLFVLRLIGGADVKLYALCVFTYPDETGLRIIYLSVVLAALYAVYLMVRSGIRGQFAGFLRYLMGIAHTGINAGAHRTYIKEADTCGEHLVPMAVFICLGAVLAVMLGSV